jgi:hypothetical protein
VFQEILRGNYQLSAVKLIANGGALAMSRISGVLIVSAISLTVIAVHTLGVWGAPLAMVITYTLTSFLAEKKFREISNAS